MVPFYLTNRTKKRIELLFSLFTKEEYDCLTKKETTDIKAFMLEISDDLTPRYFFNWKAKKEYKERLRLWRYDNLFLEDNKENKHFVKRSLINDLFDFSNRNITIDEALAIIGNEWNKFQDKKTFWIKYSEKEIVLLLKARLNKSFKPFTDNKEIFKNEFREFLECYKNEDSNIVDLCHDITRKLFVNYKIKTKKQTIQNSEIIKSIESLFTKEEKELLRKKDNKWLIDDLLFFDTTLVPVYKKIEDAKIAVERVLKIMRKDREINFSSRATHYCLFRYFLDVLFYWK